MCDIDHVYSKQKYVLRTFLIMFPVRHENIISEVFFFILFVYVFNGSMNVKGTFHLIILQTLWECYF